MRGDFITRRKPVRGPFAKGYDARHLLQRHGLLHRAPRLRV